MPKEAEAELPMQSEEIKVSNSNLSKDQTSGDVSSMRPQQLNIEHQEIELRVRDDSFEDTEQAEL